MRTSGDSATRAQLNMMVRRTLSEPHSCPEGLQSAPTLLGATLGDHVLEAGFSSLVGLQEERREQGGKDGSDAVENESRGEKTWVVELYD